MQILIGGIIQESNTFSPVISTMNDFKDHLFLVGDRIKTMDTQNEISGCYAAAAEGNVTVIPTLFGSAVSSGIFNKDSFKELKRMLFSQIRQAVNYDGVYLALHGAMVSEEYDDVEGNLLEEIRHLIGKETPLVISLDLHANITEKMVNNVNGIVGFQTYPHEDFFETGHRAAKLLFSIIKQDFNPTIAFKKLPMIVPAENSQTSHGPFADLLREARSGEYSGNSLSTSLYPVQPWLDINEMGFGVVVVANDQQKAREEVERLAKLVWQKRHEFDIELFSVTQIIKMALQEPVNVPYVISDSADSPGAGATGDSNEVLKDLLEADVQDKLTCLITIVDKPAVEKAIAAGVGATVNLNVGYSINQKQGNSISIKGIVAKIGDGKFILKGGYAENTTANMGSCVVLQLGKSSLLIGEKATFSGDPSMYRSMGLEPGDADIVMVKSANQFRACYEKISNRIYILDTWGCSPANFKKLTYHKVKRPFYPFDDNFDWSNR